MKRTILIAAGIIFLVFLFKTCYIENTLTQSVDRKLASPPTKPATKPILTPKQFKKNKSFALKKLPATPRIQLNKRLFLRFLQDPELHLNACLNAWVKGPYHATFEAIVTAAGRLTQVQVFRDQQRIFSTQVPACFIQQTQKLNVQAALETKDQDVRVIWKLEW